MDNLKNIKSQAMDSVTGAGSQEEDIRTQVINSIAQHLGVSPQDIDPESSLVDDLELGPIEVADLLKELQEEFKPLGITFMPDEVQNIKTVNDIIVLVEDKSLE